MKKTLVAAITSALVIGAASTTFAAANSFSDVPTDHWSFDAVAKLAHTGVIEGYGDNTFKGDAHITRYEMAQMVAKAMAKEEAVDAATKATIDKLAAEYADELNNLGVRVANLEKKTDNVKFVGLLRLDGVQKKDDTKNNGDKKNTGTGLLRLDMTAAVNADWNVKARLDAKTDLANDDSSIGNKNVTMVRGYAEGPFIGSTTKVGRFGGFDNAGYTNGGLILDTPVEGAEFAWNNNNFKTTLTGGRIAASDYVSMADYKDDLNSSKYYALQVDYGVNDNFKIAAGYHHVDLDFMRRNFDMSKSNNIWSLGFDYKFSKDWTFGGIYAKSNYESSYMQHSDMNDKAYSLQLSYKGVKSSVPGSYGLWIAYRELGTVATIKPTYDGVSAMEKGFEIGGKYMLDKNIMAHLVYFNGKKLAEDDGAGNSASKLFGRLEYQF